MANILVTARCNRRCTFCFAQRRISEMIQEKDKGLNMSREDIRYTMDFMERTDERALRLLGGEPTLHPEFVDIVNEALARHFHIHVFTNAMMSKEIADFLASLPKDRLSILCNISPQANDTERQISLRNYALDRLGDRVTLGITVTEPEFDYEFLLDHIRRFKLRKSIRIGVAQPIVGKDNVYLKTSDYRAAGRSIANMARACVKSDVLIGFDCGMTLCMFSEEELGVLATSSEGYSSLCDPIIDIGPNLDVWHCFPLSEVLMTNMRHFKTRREMVNYYRMLITPYKNLGCRPECLRCDYKRRGQCFGGCMAHAMNALNRLPPRRAEEVIPPGAPPPAEQPPSHRELVSGGPACPPS